MSRQAYFDRDPGAKRENGGTVAGTEGRVSVLRRGRSTVKPVGDRTAGVPKRKTADLGVRGLALGI